MLDERQNILINWLVKDYTRTAQPVSSSQLAKKKNVRCSPATIRNVLNTLENMGYISQPYTSAGRVPTTKGYRHYVNHLKKWDMPEKESHELLLEQFRETGSNVKELLEQASKILGFISNELSVVLTPWLMYGIFDRMEFIQLSANKVLAVIHVKSRLVKTIVLELDSDIKPDEPVKTASLLNERLSGLTLEEIKNTIAERTRDIQWGFSDLIRIISDSADKVFDFSEPMEILTSGTHNILSQPEFAESARLKSILNLIEDRRRLMNLFHKQVNHVDVSIGEENEDSYLHDFAVVTSCYSRGRDKGSLGIIGPVRMPYEKVLPAVKMISDLVSAQLS